MPDNEPNLVTFKIYEDDREWAELEQAHLRIRTKRKVTQADLFSKMRQAYERPVTAMDSSPMDDPNDVVIKLSGSQATQLMRVLSEAAHGTPESNQRSQDIIDVDAEVEAIHSQTAHARSRAGANRRGKKGA